MFFTMTSRHRSGSRQASVRPVLLALLFAAVLIPSALFAQDDAKKENPQTHLSEFTEPFQHTAEPAFAYHIPAKKKFKKFTERWRIVDLEARKVDAMAAHDKRIEEEKAKKSDDNQRLLELQTARNASVRYFQNTKLLLEVDGDRKESIQIEVFPVSDVRTKISDVNPRGHIESRWTKPEFQQDREVTSKSDRKKGRQGHSLILTGTPTGSDTRSWFRIETRLIPSKDQKSLYQVRYVHQMPLTKFSKKSMKDAEVLMRFWLLP